MQQIRVFILCCFFLNIFFISVDAACYSSMQCFDAAENKTYSAGDTWKTSDCYTCSCYGAKIHLLTCFEVVEENPLKSVKKSRSEARLEEEDLSKPRVVVVSGDNTDIIACPDFPSAAFDVDSQSFRFPTFQQVDYIMEVTDMSCCSLYSYPVNIHASCKSVWKQDECQYHVVNRSNESEPCPHPYSSIGK